MTKKHKAIALISGGLDSLLAARVIMEQGVDVKGVCFVMAFASKDLAAFEKNVRAASQDAGISTEFVDISEDFMEVVRNPRYGFGANLNPCIDCKILMLRHAKRIMEEEGADFIVTGEVLGERPMSQRRDALNSIKKRSGLGGLLLRPLSARLLDETIPEKDGLIDRNRLYDISGRSRQRQFELAEHYGIKKYFTPAGGCLLTDPLFSKRLADLMRHGDWGIEDVKLLKHGRHYRLDERTKAVVGRDERDNEGIIALKREGDMLLHVGEKSGPYVLLRGAIKKENIEKAASLCAYHMKGAGVKVEKIEYWTNEKDRKTITAESLDKDEVEKLRI